MIGELLIKSFLLAGLIGFLGVAFFMFLNSKSSDIDRRSYDEDFDPEKMVSSYKISRRKRRAGKRAESDSVRMYIESDKQEAEAEENQEDSPEDSQAASSNGTKNPPQGAKSTDTDLKTA